MHIKRRLAGLLQREGLGQGRVDHALRNEAIGLPRLTVIGEVRADYALEVHPEVAVVVFMHEARGGCARNDFAALAGDVDRRTKRLAAGVLEDDVNVVAAGEFANLLAEALPFCGVLRALVLPEFVVLGIAIDNEFGTHGAA